MECRVIDRTPRAYLIRPSGVAVPVHPDHTLTPETSLTPFRAQYAPPVTREFESIEAMEAFLDESWT